MKKLKQYLSEKEENENFSSTQINLPYLLSKEIINWGKENIPEDTIYTQEKDKGREKEIHTTVLYGLHDATPFRVKKIIEETKPFEVELGKISIFDKNDKFDVVKINVHCEKLHEINKKLKELPCTSKYPYEPHVTIAYVKKGSYDDKNNDAFIGEKFKVDEILFCDKNRKKIPIILK